MQNTHNEAPEHAAPPRVRARRDGALVVESGDVADRLPRAARAKLIAMRESLEDQTAIAHAASERARGAHDEKLRTDARVRQLAGNEFQRALADDESMPMIEARRLAAAAGHEYEKLRTRAKAAADRAADLRLQVERAHRWLQSLPAAAVIKTVAPPKPATTGETPAAAADRLRADIAAARADIAEVMNAPAPRAAVAQMVRAEIDRLAARGRPNLFGLIERSGTEISWPMVSTRVEVSGIAQAKDAVLNVRGFGGGQQIDALALMCWAHRDAILAAFDAELAEATDDQGAMADQERGAREIELRAKLLEIERAEVAAVEAAGTLRHRADLDPRALLGVSGPAMED